MSKSDEGVHIGNASCIRESDKAILVEFHDLNADPKKLWIPKSQVHDDSEVWEDGQDGEVVISTWFAQQKDLA